MTDNANSQLSEFEQKQIRRVWHKEDWYYSIVDVIAILTDSARPSVYWSNLKARTKKEGFDEALAQIESLQLKSQDGRMRQTDTATRQTLLRIIQSIPSPKAEPFRLWLAQVGEERFAEIENPELTIERVRSTYRAKGYGEDWIEQRIRTDVIRNELTDEWSERGAQEGVQYAILTNEINEGTFELSIQAHKQYKLLPVKSNLRDHMTTLELALISLGEATATLFHRERDSHGFQPLKKDARDAGNVAGKSREMIEEEVGHSVVSSENHLRLEQPKETEEKQTEQLEMFPEK